MSADSREEPWDVPSGIDRTDEHDYGHPLSGEKAAEIFGEDFSARDVVTAIIWTSKDQHIKPRRGTPEVHSQDFFSSLVKSSDGRWFFSGVLNGWPALKLLELKQLDRFVSMNSTKSKMYWNNNDHRSIRDPYAANVVAIKATLLQPKFKDFGYSMGVPGLLWYYSGENNDPSMNRFSHGANTILASELHEKERHGDDLPKITMVHHFAHRYAKLKENFLDTMSYHTGLLLEWDHGEYCTVVENAWRNGIGGYKGQSNWVHDKEAQPSSLLYSLMPADMKEPWNIHQSELRIIEIPVKGLNEFMEYMKQYSGADKRFLDPLILNSQPALIVHRTKPDLCRFLTNYIMQNSEYSLSKILQKKPGFNCQAFSATCFGFLTNVRIVMPSFGLKLTQRYKMFAVDYVTGKVMQVNYEKTDRKLHLLKKSKYLKTDIRLSIAWILFSADGRYLN